MLFYPATTFARTNHLQLTLDEALELQGQLTSMIRKHLATNGMTIGDTLKTVYTPPSIGDDDHSLVTQNAPTGFVTFCISIAKDSV